MLFPARRKDKSLACAEPVHEIEIKLNRNIATNLPAIPITASAGAVDKETVRKKEPEINFKFASMFPSVLISWIRTPLRYLSV